ncbi:MAG: MBL fold metallo-hydrolase [Nitrospirae bacterium]|nr:MBL fold metallo-hydrolase [Nitrospirota bacterium]
MEPVDVFGNVKQGELYSSASTMIDDWYAVEAIDTQTFAINEPKSSQYNTSYLIVGDARAIMFDAGSGERLPGSRSMREVAEQYTDKPITLILSHFHYDHIYDAPTFDGITFIDRPEIRTSIQNGVFTISPWESLDTERRSLKVASIRNQVFAGDFIYRHLGGIIAFAPGSDLVAYKANSARLLQLTNPGTLFLGAHGIPRFGRDWLTLLNSALEKIVRGEAEYRYVAHYLAPGIPWRVHQNGEMSIYTTPLVDPQLFWSRWMLLLLVTVFILSLYVLHRIARLPFAPVQRDE